MTETNLDLSERCDIEFWDDPNDKTGSFESSEKNYYRCTVVHDKDNKRHFSPILLPGGVHPL